MPIGDEYYDSSSGSISVGNFSMQDVANFAYFEHLSTVYAGSAQCYDETLALRELRPGLKIIYTVDIGGVDDMRMSA